MELTTVKEIIEILSGERRVFNYFPDRYALMLLSDYLDELGDLGKKDKQGKRTIPIADLKQSPYAKLLNKAPVKKALAMAGNGKLSKDLLSLVWNYEEALSFVMTLDIWGDGKKYWRWNQMSRSGYHLVLQLNMANDHTQQYQRLIRPDEPFSMGGHPVLVDGKRETLAWVRLDLDFQTDEVLIEEIQCDWIREAKEALRDGYEWYGDYEPEELEEYVNVVLAPYMKVWQEAMLAAAIHFIRHELGIRTIYYHSFETGARLKNIQDYLPPRSLYTQLPRQFAFQKTPDGPEFLMREKRVQKLQKRVQEPYWFTLPTVA